MIHIIKPQIGTPLNPYHPLAKKILGYWPFLECGGDIVYDYSKYGNNGTLNSCTWTQQGVKFNGSSSYISMGDPSELDIATEDFNISLWFYSYNVASTQVILEKHESSGQYQGYQIAIVSSKLRFYICSAAPEITISTNTTLQSNTWYHVFIQVIRAGNATIWLNGKLDQAASVAGESGTLVNSDNFEISRSTTSQFNGIINNVFFLTSNVPRMYAYELYLDPYCMFRQDPVEVWAYGSSAPSTVQPVVVICC